MKKKFMSISLIVSMICMALTYASEEQRNRGVVDGKLKFGNNSICSWEILRFEKPGEGVKKCLIPELLNENFSISSQNGEVILQISPEGKLIIGACKEQKWSVAVDARGRTIFDTKQKKGIGVALLDEGDVCEEIDLKPGSSFISFFYDEKDTCDGVVKVTYDKIIKLKNEAYSSTSNVLLSRWSASQQVFVATHGYRDGTRKGKTEVYVEESKKEIQLLDYLFQSNKEEEKKKLLSKLSIVEHAGLLVNLDAHGCDYPDDWNQLLRRKIFHLLAEARPQDVSCFDKSTELLEKTPQKAQFIIKNILENIRFEAIQVVKLGIQGESALVEYRDGKAKIIDLENGKTIFEEQNGLKLKIINGRVFFRYHENGSKELVNLGAKTSFLWEDSSDNIAQE